MLDAPIFLGGALVGVVCHEHVGPRRRWQPWEELVAGTFADFETQSGLRNGDEMGDRQFGTDPIFILISPIIQSLDCLSPTLNRPLHLAMHDRSAGTIVVEATKRDETGTPVAEPATVGADRDHSDGGTK